jgi:hypothetical protein
MSKTPLHQLIFSYCQKWALISLLLIIAESSCNNPRSSDGGKTSNDTTTKPSNDTIYNNWLRWNITFKPNVDSQTREEGFADARKHLDEYVDSFNRRRATNFRAIDWKAEKSDSLNYIITAGLRGLAADSISPPPVKDGPKLNEHVSKLIHN